LNLTLVSTWVVMALLVFLSWLATRRLVVGPRVPKLQNLMEIIIENINRQIREVSHQRADRFLPFIGTLFLFILLSNMMSVIPWFTPPTASLSTTVALALCVLLAVPIYGISERGFGGYLKQYIKPTPLMLPFNIIGELSRTLALAVRLFGNMMSGAKIAAILLLIAPLFFPVLMNALSLLTGVIQAYIFAILALVYIASATQAHEPESPPDENRNLPGETPHG
jgi:F-type H+-transporting ATPase subunit a